MGWNLVESCKNDGSAARSDLCDAISLVMAPLRTRTGVGVERGLVTSDAHREEGAVEGPARGGRKGGRGHWLRRGREIVTH